MLASSFPSRITDMKRIAWLSASAAVVLLGARLAGAQPQPPTFEEIDKDKNGSLSKDEVAAWFEARRAAGNRGAGGGGATGGPPPGAGGAGPRDPAQIFARWDANADGKVTKEEFEARPRGGGGGGPPRN
jgi:hypothetical protein